MLCQFLQVYFLHNCSRNDQSGERASLYVEDVEIVGVFVLVDCQLIGRFLKILLDFNSSSIKEIVSIGTHRSR